MNAYRLTRDTTADVPPRERPVWACGRCHRIQTSSLAPSQADEARGPGWSRPTTAEEHDAYARNFAERCCHVTCTRCGKEMKGAAFYETVCRDCWGKVFDEDCARKDRERYEKAKKVPHPEYQGEYLTNGSDFFSDLDAVYDHYDGNGDPVPEWLWGCTEDKLDYDFSEAVQSHIHDNHHEDAVESVSPADWKELREFGDKWCEKSGVVSYNLDYSTVVLIPKRDDDEPAEAA